MEARKKLAVHQAAEAPAFMFIPELSVLQEEVR
jgi:hypothetical protein